MASLYDPLHPAVLMLIAHTIASAEKIDVPVSVCGELAGDPELTRLLLGMGLRIFSMHPTQILEVKSRCSDRPHRSPPRRAQMLRLDDPPSCAKPWTNSTPDRPAAGRRAVVRAGGYRLQQLADPGLVRDPESAVCRPDRRNQGPQQFTLPGRVRA